MGKLFGLESRSFLLRMSAGYVPLFLWFKRSSSALDALLAFCCKFPWYDSNVSIACKVKGVSVVCRVKGSAMSVVNDFLVRTKLLIL